MKSKKLNLNIFNYKISKKTNSIKIKKLYPNKIIITVLEDAPIVIYFEDSGKKHILLENNKIIKNSNYEFDNLPEVQGKGALQNYSNFYSKLKR